MAENHALIPEPAKMYAQADPLKDAKDLTKNLVSGDFEKRYTDDMIEKQYRDVEKKACTRRLLCIILGVIVAALATWIVALAALHEVQLARLRSEVDELTVNLIAATANLKSLNKKIADNKWFNEMKILEDTIYADDDMTSPRLEETSEGKSDVNGMESIEKLDGLTVLENEMNLDDDEDLYDDDDQESGDYYQDYNHRRQKIGTTNMEHLRPEDFTDTVVTFSQGKKDYSNSNRELKRLLEAKVAKFNALPTVSSEDIVRNKRNVFPEAPPEVLDSVAMQKVSKNEERRKTKKFSSSSDFAVQTSRHPITRTIRSDDEVTARKPFIAAHFHGNTSHLNTEIHEHYKGNGLVRVPHDAPHDVWYPSPWTIASPHPRPTLTRKGHVHVHHTGVYLVYVQIYYLDSHDVISWVLHRTNAETVRPETLLQCAQSSHSVEPMDKPNSCFSAAALFLKAGDKLAVRNTGGDRHSLMQPEKSFIGLVKLADAEDPDEAMEF